MCLITFLMLSLSVILPGVPMHLIGLIGRSDTQLHIISALLWVTTVVVVVLYLLHRMPLKAAVSTFGILVQLAESARIVYITVERPEGYEEAVLFNQIISLALIIYLVLAAVRHMPTVIALMSIGTIVFAYLYTDGGVNRQIVVVFIFVEIFTCVLGEMNRRGIRGMLKENADYNSTLNNLLATFHMTKTELLATFHMTKTELLAYIQLGRGGMAGKDISDFFDRLDERTEANLIRAVEHRVAQRRMQHADIASALPTLTPTEKEVCRLIIGGKTICEIASILNKKPNNISTVRIHIRKKLGLATNEDLKEALLESLRMGDCRNIL